MSWHIEIYRDPAEFDAMTDEQKDALTYADARQWIPSDSMAMAAFQGMMAGNWTPRQIAEHVVPRYRMYYFGNPPPRRMTADDWNRAFIGFQRPEAKK